MLLGNEYGSVIKSENVIVKYWPGGVKPAAVGARGLFPQKHVHLWLLEIYH